MIKYCGCVSPKFFEIKPKPRTGVTDPVKILNKNLLGHLYQDKEYGKGKRVMSYAPAQGHYVCSVCTKRHN